MSNSGRVYPAKDAGIIAINPQKQRVRAILNGLAGRRSLQIVESAGLDLRPASLAQGDIETALNSAGRRPQTGILQVGKQLFLKWQYNWCYRRFEGLPPRIVACWNGLKGHRFLALSAAQRCGHSTLYLEEAPLPGRITVDFAGINYGSSLPRRADFYHKWLEQNPGVDPVGWRGLKSELCPRAARQRQHAGEPESPDRHSREKYIFCPLQLPGDSQITVYGDWVSSIDDLIDQLETAASALPEGWHLRLKEHPGTRKSLAARLLPLAEKRIILDNAADTMELVEASEAVVTLNSSVGFESFFFDKPVIVLGHAFYAFDRLATKADSCGELAGLFAAPQQLSFDGPARNAFMSYVTERHFPNEQDVVAGRITLDDIVARDRARDELLGQLGEC